MSGAKRGRPALPEAEKRQQVGVRTSPSLKADLERASGENGRSVAQEAELRLVQSFQDEARAGGRETAQLLSMIANEIAIIERQTKKHWHRDLTTWSAVAEMLAKGPIRMLRPDRATDDEVVEAAWVSLWDVMKRKQLILEELRAARLIVEDRPVPSSKRLGGMLGSRTPDLGRQSIRTQIEARRDLDEAERGRLNGLVDQLHSLDEEERLASARYSDALAPYVAAEQKGVQLMAELRREAAAKARASGAPFDIGMMD